MGGDDLRVAGADGGDRGAGPARRRAGGLERWELHHAVVGEVNDTGELRAFWDDEVVGAVPARYLTEECPRYAVAREPRPAPPEAPLPELPPSADALLRLLASDALRSRAFVYRRYDQLVQSRTVRRPGLDAAVLRLRPSYRGLAVTLDGTGRMGALDPFTGGALAVLEAARNVACAGGEPLGITDCLNFGNPEKPQVGWELAEAIEGIAQACEALGIPVVSGNVSLYNDTDGVSIPPTPVVGCVGLVEDVRLVPRGWCPGDALYLASAGPARAGRSEYQAQFGETTGAPAELDLAAEAALVRFLAALAPAVHARPRLRGGRPRGRPGRSRLWSGCGAELALPDEPVALFGEGGGQAVLALAPDAHLPSHRPASGCSGWARPGGATLLGVRCRAPRRLGQDLMCGVFGIRSPERDVARLVYFGLFALQHRGQESAGIAVSDQGRITALRDMGLVPQVFREEHLQALPGELAIGHTRYSTTGSSAWANAQPVVHSGSARQVALGHNGNLVNAAELRAGLHRRGIQLASTSDTEVIAALIAHDAAPLPEAVATAMQLLEGAYSVTALADETLVAFRDPLAVRPLSLGRIGDDWVVASETCALDLVGADWVRDVRPGEVVWVDGDGLHAAQAVPSSREALCIFEHVYFARPDSRLAGTEVYGARVKMGERLAAEGAGRRRLRDADPGLGHPCRDRVLEGLRDTLRGGPDQEPVRPPDVHPARSGPAGAGNPAQVQPALGHRGPPRRDRRRLDRPREHDAPAGRDAVRRRSGECVRISSPPVVSPCFYGIDMADEDELAAAHRSVEGNARDDRRDLAALPLAGRDAGCHRAAGDVGLPRVLHARLPDARPRGEEPREAALRARAGVVSRSRPGGARTTR